MQRHPHDELLVGVDDFDVAAGYQVPAVADIQTSDMLKLPVPKVNYHNIKTKPSEIQTEMVANLAKRAEKVRARLVEPNIDNMLKITNDGRKLALDQRMIDPMLPDDPDSKVNACVDNVYRI